MSVPGFPHTMDELGNRIRSERQRLECERLEFEYSRHFPDAPILESIIGDLKRESERADRLVEIWAWIIGAIVIGAMTGLLFWVLPPEFQIGVGITWVISLIGCGYFVWDSFKRHRTGGRS